MRTIAGSRLELVLLGLLRGGPRSGYDLRRILTQSPMRHFSSSPGAIYPALGRLAERRWVGVGAPGGGRGRREFRLNARGRQALGRWLRRPVTRDDVVMHADELVLRLALMDGFLSPAAIQRFLQQYIAAMAAYLEELRRYDVAHAAAMPPLARLAFQHGLGSYEGALAWGKRALHVLRPRDEGPRPHRKRRPR